MRHVLIDAGGAAWLAQVNVPIHLVVGDDDRIVDLAFLHELTDSLGNVRVSLWPGGHDLPLTHAEDCVGVIRAALAQRG